MIAHVDDTAVAPGLTWTGKRHWTNESRWRVGARKLGISFNDYRAHVLNGERWCSIHKTWQPVVEFGKHTGRADGLNTACVSAVRKNAEHSMARLRAERRAS